MKQFLAIAVLALVISTGASAAVDPAIYTDPPHDAAHPARMEVVHIPSGGVEINGLVYVAAGAGPHPTLVLCHGLPGNEKNLDLAQAIRRAGWNVVTFNYRGSWGSPGDYSFTHDLEDVKAVLAFVRTPGQAAALGIDPTRIALAGHSLGGWVTALTAAEDHGLIGAATISAGAISERGKASRDVAVKRFADNGVEALAGTSAEKMADEAIANRDRFGFERAAPGLSNVPLLVLTSDDGGAPMSQVLVDGARAAGNRQVQAVHIATDHSWSDARVKLADTLIGWLRGL